MPLILKDSAQKGMRAYFPTFAGLYEHVAGRMADRKILRILRGKHAIRDLECRYGVSARDVAERIPGILANPRTDIKDGMRCLQFLQYLRDNHYDLTKIAEKLRDVPDRERGDAESRAIFNDLLERPFIELVYPRMGMGI